MDNRVRIIQLGPVDSPPQSYTFEDAFGEFSEARGSWRERRKKRILKRIADRKEIRKARIEARRELQQERIAKRTAAQQARQEKRTLAARARQERRTERKQARVNRRAIGQEEDAAVQEQGLDTGVSPDMGGATVDSQDTGGATDSQDTGGATDSQDTGATDTNYGTEESSADYGQEEAAPESDGSEGAYSEEGDYAGGGDYLGEYDGGDVPFDGVLDTEDGFSEFADGITIDPKVQDTVDKLVWNKELVSRLEKQRNMVGGHRKQGLSKQIILRKKRANELLSQLDGYCNVEGEYSGADGKAIASKRRAEIAKAHRIAMMRRRRRVHKPLLTPVAKGLNPSISPNKIVVPAKSAFTGLNGLDLQDDFDAPNVRDIQLGADGSTTSKISWTSVAIGLAVGAAAIWALKKYKVVK